jgi:hypothetical protein
VFCTADVAGSRSRSLDVDIGRRLCEAPRQWPFSSWCAHGTQAEDYGRTFSIARCTGSCLLPRVGVAAACHAFLPRDASRAITPRRTEPLLGEPSSQLVATVAQPLDAAFRTGGGLPEAVSDRRWRDPLIVDSLGVADNILAPQGTACGGKRCDNRFVDPAWSRPGLGPHEGRAAGRHAALNRRSVLAICRSSPRLPGSNMLPPAVSGPVGRG